MATAGMPNWTHIKNATDPASRGVWEVEAPQGLQSEHGGSVCRTILRSMAASLEYGCATAQREGLATACKIYSLNTWPIRQWILEVIDSN